MALVNEELRRRGADRFVCECGDPGCTAFVPAGHQLAPGHEPQEDLALIRDALRARVHDAWERLEDAVTELHALHDVPREEIVERVGAELDA